MKLNKGFTLIELLIVIGVLAILATGLLAAVDPFEQLKKARDANNRNAAIETLNALTRYYATHGILPWNTTQADCVKTVFNGLRGIESGYPHKAVKMSNAGSTDYNADVNNCINETLLADGELKSEFFSGLAATIYLASGSTTKAIVCFAPEGKALRNDTNATGYVFDGTDTISARVPATDCSSATCVSCYE